MQAGMRYGRSAVVVGRAEEAAMAFGVGVEGGPRYGWRPVDVDHVHV